MIFKLLIFAILAVGIYRFFGGRVPSFKLPGFGTRRTNEKDLDDDTLVECAKCGTYVTLKESIISRGKYYCSVECLPK